MAAVFSRPSISTPTIRSAIRASAALARLAALSGVLALATSLAGLLWPGAGEPVPFETVRGETVLLYGQGLYRYDTLFSAGAFKGSDLLVLFGVLPLLVVGLAGYRRGSLRATFLLAGTLSYLLYNGASMAFGAALNPLFLVYVALFSSSLFAFVLALTVIDRAELPAHIEPRLPRRAAAAILFLAGPGTALLWLSDIVGPLLEGRAPVGLGSYTTLFTYGLDIGLIAPAATLAGILLLRRDPLGYVLGVPILVLCALIGPMVILQTVMQLRVGVEFIMMQFAVIIIGGFVAMSLLAAGVTVAVFRQISDRRQSMAR